MPRSRRFFTALLDRPLPWLLAAALLPVALYFVTGWQVISGHLGFPLDDSFIHLQFARSLATGEGLSYNPGELVTGSTAPLWTALVSLLFLLPGDPSAWTLMLGVALHLAVIDATYRLGRELGLERGLATFAAGLTLATYWLVWSALSGMEIPLFTALSLWGTILHLRERRRPARPPLALPVLALSTLARPEGVLLLALALADRLVVVERAVPGLAAAEVGPGLRLARPPWRALGLGLGLAALALVPSALFYQLVGGSPLPSTFAAKAGAGHRLLPDPQYLHLVLGIFFKPQPVMTLAAAAGVLRLAEGLGGRRDRGLLPALWLIGLPVAYSTLTSPGRVLVGNFGRYFFPLFPFLVVVGALGVERAARALGVWRAGRHRLPLGAALAVLVACPTLITLAANTAFYATNVANVEDSDVRLGRWLRANVPPDAVLALQDIGAVKYLAPNRVIDLVGLVTPELARQAHATARQDDPLGTRGVLAYLDRTRPDLLAAFTNFRPGLTADPRFRPLLRLEVPHNITMAGDELVLYLTPWSRLAPPAPGTKPQPANQEP